MNLEKYSKDKLIYFLQLTLSQTKLNIIYFSLNNFDKLFIDMNIIDWTRIFIYIQVMCDIIRDFYVNQNYEIMNELYYL